MIERNGSAQSPKFVAYPEPFQITPGIRVLSGMVWDKHLISGMKIIFFHLLSNQYLWNKTKINGAGKSGCPDAASES